jgi:uncharacterized protein YbjQ (UPF0145 family)
VLPQSCAVGAVAVDGSYVRRRHPQNGPDFEPMDSAGVSEWIRQHGADFAIPRSRIVTLDHVPGHRVRDVLGLVTELTSASGWTAKIKGNTALEGALGNLVDSAVELGANAIIGVQAATFGAGGGITNVVGGDAVGVLITGTAVFVEKEPSPV